MEGVALVLIGALLFSHSWYLLGLYPDGRTMGIFTGGLALALLVSTTFTPMLLIGEGLGAKVTVPDIAEVNLVKMLIILWATFGVGVAAQGLWEFDERAIGFYSAFPAVGSLGALLYFFGELQGRYGDGVWLSLSGATLVLTILAVMLFCYLAIPAFNVLRPVTGWFVLVGSVAVSGIGLLIATTVITSSV